MSASAHLLALSLVLSIGGGGPIREGGGAQDTIRPERLELHRVVFLAERLPPSGGGGGGGNRQPAPMRHAESVGNDTITVPIAPSSSVLPLLENAEDADPRPDSLLVPADGLLLNARPLASGITEQVGLPEGGVSFGTSTGPGAGGGAGDGVGSGIGSGKGPGLGPGSGGGTGGGIYRVGGSVTSPRVLTQVQPVYTPEGLSQRIQGSVVLELIVTREGQPSAIRILRSLDPGLDQEAIKAVQQWQFSPGRLGNIPVDVVVSVAFDFAIR
jgi:periplasmic protein TonB